MPLEVDPPEPPALETFDPNEYDDAEVVGDTDYRREEITEYLHAGAWEQAFEAWAAETDIGEREFAIIAELGLIEEFDFFWDGFAERVGYHAPGIAEDWQEREYHPDIDSWETVAGINAALTELGQGVCDLLLEEYIDWESEYEAPDDLPDF